LALRSGDVLTVRVDGSALHLRGRGVDVRLEAGDRVALPGGHRVSAVVDVAAVPVPRTLIVDSTFLHAAMVAWTAMLVALSALWFAPRARLDEGGAGLPADARRWLSLPGGVARHQGRPVWSSRGRRPHDAERPTVPERRGVPLPRRAGAGPSLEETLAAMKQALHGSAGGGAVDPVGDLRRAIAVAPVLGAGVGGLAPRDPAVIGSGTSIIAAGEAARLSALLRARVERSERMQPPSPPAKTTYPVQLLDLPAASVDTDAVDAVPDLDPIVREQLLRAVRLRGNVLRGCYEAWGLAADPRRTGRLVVEFTLRPDGHAVDVTTVATDGLRLVGDCVRRAAVEWYLGDGLVDAPTRLSFPFVLRPRR
jgi:hypothetical protein